MKTKLKIGMATLAGAAVVATVPTAQAVGPEPHVAGAAALTAATGIENAAKDISEKKAKAKAKRQKEKRQESAVPGPQNGMIEGVSVSTLEAIAACESGGDPGAVNPAGYYGKYQFDQGTWASVGGSGNPAEASEAEQDYRAALLYSRAGSSPWPVCGQ